MLNELIVQHFCVFAFLTDKYIINRLSETPVPANLKTSIGSY